MSDMDERAWFVFELPGGTNFVPADTEEQARRQMRATHYPGAPVDSWPCTGTRYTSRHLLARELLRRAR